MSSERYLLERLPFYLNGTLTEEESAEVERLLAESPENRRELELTQVAARIYGHQLPTEILVAYAFDGEHPEIPTELIERYLAASPIARDELELIRQSQAALESELSAPRQPDVVRPFPRPQEPAAPVAWRRMALAASIVGVMALGMVGWQAVQIRESGHLLATTEQQLRDALARDDEPAGDRDLLLEVEQLEEERSRLAAGKDDLVGQLEESQARIEQLGEQIAEFGQPLVNMPVVDIHPGDGDLVLRGPRDENVNVVPRQTRTVLLILNSDTKKDQRITGMSILAADGSQVWRSGVAPQRDKFDTFTVAIPVQELGVGRYTVQLVEQLDDRTEVVEAYQIEIR